MHHFNKPTPLPSINNSDILSSAFMLESRAEPSLFKTDTDAAHYYFQVVWFDAILVVDVCCC